MHETFTTPELKQNPTLSRFYDWFKQRTEQKSSSWANKTRQHDKTRYQEDRYVTPRSH